MLQSESMKAGDKSAYQPFDGFYWLGLGVMVLFVIAVLFVSYKVMRRMNKTEKEE
ncbi:MAG: hypothetical protein ACLFUB_00680 [Cyclobacteriaceae bacterium]